MKQTDQEILARLKKPIDDLVNRDYQSLNPQQSFHLRQLAWQAVDTLVRTKNTAGLKNQKDIRSIARNVRKMGVSEKFIKDSLNLAIRIYRRLQVEHPGLLKRYRGKF